MAQNITIRGADANLFPQPDPAKGDLFMVTIEDRTTNKQEICECFRRVGPVLSLRRGREGTSPETFIAGATVSNRLTARTIEAGLLGWIEFNRRYLGSYAIAPTLDPMGFPIQAGAVYYDLNTDCLFVYTRDGWVKWSPSGDMQTGIPPGGIPGEVLTRNTAGGIEWRSIVDQAARDSAQLARDASVAAQAAAAAATTLAGTKLDQVGGTITGQTAIRFPADVSGNRTSMLSIDSAGSGASALHFTRGGRLWRGIGVVGDGEPAVAMYTSQGAFLGWQKLLTAADALPSTGGGVSGDLTVTGAFTVTGPADLSGGTNIRNLRLVRQNDAADGGEIFFEAANAQQHSFVIDNALNQARFFRAFDNALLMTISLLSGDVNMLYGLQANTIRSNVDVFATETSWAKRFRFHSELGGDTGYDHSGDGFSTIISNGQPVAQFQPGGNVYVWGNITGFSDARFKEDIEPITDAMDIVRKLQGVRFRRKDSEDRARHIGFLAQDVELIAPEVVTRTQDGMLGINYAVMVSLLAEAVKALDTRLTELEEDTTFA